MELGVINASIHKVNESVNVADIDRLGNAFFSVTAEYAIRLSGQIGLGAFYEAGNVWRNA